MFRKILCLLVIGLTPLALVRGQSPTGGSGFLDIISVQQELGLSLNQNFEHQFKTDTESNTPGDVSANSFTTSLDYAQNWQRDFVRAGISYEYTDWNWGGPEFLGDTNQIGFNVIGGKRIGTTDWGVFGLGGFSFGAETGADLADGGTYRVGFGGTYYFGQRSSVSLGVLIIGGGERAVRVIPIPILNWQITKQLNLRTFNGFTLSYDVFGDKSTEVDFTTQFESNFYRLDTGTYFPGVTRTPGVEVESVVLAAGVTQRLGSGFYIRGYIEGMVNREFNFRDNDISYQRFDTDPALAIGLQAGISF